MVPRGLELRTLWLLAVRSNQLSYETHWLGSDPWVCKSFWAEGLQVFSAMRPTRKPNFYTTLFFGSPPQRWWLKCKEVVRRGWKEYYSSGPHHKGDGSARHKRPLANKNDSCGIWTHAVYTSGTWVHPLRPLGQTVAACGADLKRSKLTSHFDICLQCRLKGLARSPRRRRKDVPEHFWQPWQWSSYSSQQGHVNKDAHNHSGPARARTADLTVIGCTL